MNLNIALIEDMAEHRKEFRQLAEGYAVSYPEDSLNLTFVTDLTEFETLFVNANPPHAVFVDIELGGLFGQENGITLARRLREEKYPGEIIFLTSHTDYVFDGYGLDALAYLTKPINKQILFPVFKKIIKRLQPKTWTYQSEQGLINLPYNQILYFTVDRREITMITKSSSNTFRGTLIKLISSLPPEFVFCHRSFLVNLDHVQHVRSNSLLLSNASVLPVSRSYYKPLLEEINRRI